MKTFIALLSVSLIALAVAQAGTGLSPTSTTTSTNSWTAGCAYVTSWPSTPVFAYCSGCATGYYQNTTQSNCTKITVSNCAAVSSASATTCIACAKGFYLSSGSCTACPSTSSYTGTTACSSATTATAVLPGFYITSSGAPSYCLSAATNGIAVSGCAQCDPSGNNVCIACATGYWVAGSSVTAFGNGCVTTTVSGCYIGTSTTCTTPAPGYTINAGTPVPVPTASLIANCLVYGSSASICAECNQGYSLNTAGTACVLCTTISTTAGSTCSGPAVGYYVNASTSASGSPIVQFPTGVATAIYNQNLTCSNGYYLTQTGMCISGSLTDTNCAIANSTSVCVGCNSGYYFSTNLTCGACGANCGTCTNSSICTACTNTTLYTLQSNGTCTNKTSSANILAPSFAILSMIFYYLF